ncbi:unnamed protein product [Staurois parvus]|uniref:Uncharacterized protein n=1 Tax=Staurois parvus TaxID=386267 RepID=A0ABN9BIN9_9NEOB|nr:unnamed protein product [Staurois parvus]
MPSVHEALNQCFSIPVLMDPQQVMFSRFPLFCTGDLISFTALVITTAVSSEGNPENMTCWGSMRTGVEKHCCK